MTTVDVVLTPGVDTDQTASAQSQINAAPDGTAGSPTIINMPVGRYRIDGSLSLVQRSHIRWTCLAGIQTYPAIPTPSQAFIAYTDVNTLSPYTTVRAGHFRISACLDVVGSFLRIEGPRTYRNAAGFATYNSNLEPESGFKITTGGSGGSIRSEACGFEDCSCINVSGDGFYIGGSNYSAINTNVGCWVSRISAPYSGRHGIAIVDADGFAATDFDSDLNAYAGCDVEPNGNLQVGWNLDFTRCSLAGYLECWAFVGAGSTRVTKKNIRMTDCGTQRAAKNFGSIHGASGGPSGNAGYFIVTRFTDTHNTLSPGIQVYGFDDVTIDNCQVSTINRSANGVHTTSYAVNASANNTLKVINNNFNALTGTGFDQLYMPTNAPVFTHYGNVWAAGAQNDGAAPTDGIGAFAAAPAKMAGAGTASDLSQGHIEAGAASFGGIGSVTYVEPDAPFPQVGVGGAPERFRSRKGGMQLRAGSRMRGSAGPSERHVTRLRSSSDGNRLRSALFDNFQRSGVQGIAVTGSGGITAAAASLHGTSTSNPASHGQGNGAVAVSAAGTGQVRVHAQGAASVGISASAGGTHQIHAQGAATVGISATAATTHAKLHGQGAAVVGISASATGHAPWHAQGAAKVDISASASSHLVHREAGRAHASAGRSGRAHALADVGS